MNNVKKENTTLVDELVPGTMSVGSVQKVLQNLLRERVPIRDLVTILEALSDYASQTKDLNTLTEYVRQSLARTIFSLYRDSEGKVTAITLAPEIERMISEVIQSGVQKGASLALPPRFIEEVTSSLHEHVERMGAEGLQPLLVLSPTIRQYFKRLVEPVFPNLVVISYAELPQTAEIVSFGTVQTEKESVLT
jgi:flagellar biosynthesis protein FlhA